MTYSRHDASDAEDTLAKFRGAEDGELGAALTVVGLSAARAEKEARLRDEMVRVAHRSGASIRQLAEISGLGRKAVTAIVSGTTPANPKP